MMNSDATPCRESACDEQQAAAKTPRASTDTLRSEPIEDLLVRLADLVLGDEELHTKWFNMVEAARKCRTHKLSLGIGKWGCKDMDYHCRLYFDQRWDIRRDGVKVTWRTEATDNGMEFQIRFHRLDPANDVYFCQTA